MRGRLAMAATGGGAALLLGIGVSVTALHSAAFTSSTIVGTWTDTVTPNAPGGTFVSTLVFTSSGAVIEATSKPSVAPTADTSTGLGAWKTDGDKVNMTFQKYRFDANGNYIGTTVIVETDSLAGADAYNGNAVTTLYNPAGTRLASFTSSTHGVRVEVPDVGA